MTGGHWKVWPADHMCLVEPIENRDPIAAEEQKRCHVQLCESMAFRLFRRVDRHEEQNMQARSGKEELRQS